MPEHAYTIHDTPAVIRRVDKDLNRIRSEVKKADPHLVSLVLTGGFARGEGAVVGDVPQNDYDLLAIRGMGRPRVPYERVRCALEAELGIHVDLAPVAKWRLRFTEPSIFWYETALRARVLWGEDLLSKIPIRDPAGLNRREGLRLLANRAAGLMLVTRTSDPHAYRIQAAKGILAAMDMVLLAQGSYAPSQVERRKDYLKLVDSQGQPDHLHGMGEWIDWAFRFKVSPDSCAPKDPMTVWRMSAQAVWASVPLALSHAGVSSLEDCAHRDRWVDRVYYATQASKVPEGRRFLSHPTGRVRVATLRLLEASLDGEVAPSRVRAVLAPLAATNGDPLGALERLRAATLQ